MSIANILLGLVIASIFGSAFHFWKGGSLKWLLYYLLISWCGFWVMHIIASLMKISFIKLGPINLGPAILGAIGALLLGHWLSMAGAARNKK